MISFINTKTSTYNNLQVGTVYSYSDGREKTNIESLDGCLGTILSLRPVSYNWRTNTQQSSDSTADMSAARSMPMGPQGDTNRQFGFIAQELEEVLPDVVKTTEEGEKFPFSLRLIGANHDHRPYRHAGCGCRLPDGRNIRYH